MQHFIFIIIIIIDARIASANNEKGAIIIYALLIWNYKKTVYSIKSLSTTSWRFVSFAHFLYGK